MVPHGRVEEVLHQADGSDTPVFAVIGIPDEHKREKLMVLHMVDESRIPELLDRLAQQGLRNIFIPRPDHQANGCRTPRLYSFTVIFIATGSSGLSRSSRGSRTIASTTSIPRTTSPNTV